MLDRFRASLIFLLPITIFFPFAFAQNSPPEQSGKLPSYPAPRHDISGTWEPANGPADGIQPIGVKAMPADGKPEHELPYTPLGLATFNSHKAQEGVNEVLSAS